MPTEGDVMARLATVGNQNKILSNQKKIERNQKRIIKNQMRILAKLKK
jgi:hypothetical protein